MANIPIYLERGSTSVFAVALDWPGWCRRAKSENEAIETLDAYRRRYAQICGRAPVRGSFEVVATLKGNATTDFGAPSAMGPWDDSPMTPSTLRRQLKILRQHWEYFDAAVLAAPNQLRKGPRGGGRDRDAMSDHVREAERAYCSKTGVRVPPRTPWPDQRLVVLAALEEQSELATWPARYAIRRLAWHVADHAWEIEERSAVP
jgi:hypothetical protein